MSRQVYDSIDKVRTVDLIPAREEDTCTTENILGIII